MGGRLATVHGIGPYGYGSNVYRLRLWSRAWNWASILIMGPSIYAYYLRPYCADLLDIRTSYPILATTVATASPSTTHLQMLDTSVMY
ncbi:UNVERIFIED_CONTAM: hypothetical protein Sradi_0173100 [Sesamum radiatum]|uniref:Uncharacterized protein n=1 Tax=Sesamum radiatum TaxID=300843 RepID=A0AAW2VYL1_SESRA